MNPKSVIIVSGHYGQLGSEIQQLSLQYPQFHFVFSDHDTLDITNEQAVKDAFEKFRPAYFINCAAYTAVDKAETERERCMSINADAVSTIAKYCNEHNTKLIHISTDYVFNGKGEKPYQPCDTTDPVNYYGYTKWIGEKSALENNRQTIIIRTSWVYSVYGHNFVKTMLRLMSERRELSVVNDQTGSPTYAKDLAAAILQIVEKTNGHNEMSQGIYHFSNVGVISWYDFATAIGNIIKSDCKINPILTTAYPTPAARPAYSVMDISKIQNDFDILPTPWRESLEKCISQLEKQ